MLTGRRLAVAIILLMVLRQVDVVWSFLICNLPRVDHDDLSIGPVLLVET